MFQSSSIILLITFAYNNGKECTCFCHTSIFFDVFFHRPLRAKRSLETDSVYKNDNELFESSNSSSSRSSSSSSRRRRRRRRRFIPINRLAEVPVFARGN